jgi:TPR repeat protein
LFPSYWFISLRNGGYIVINSKEVASDFKFAAYRGISIAQFNYAIYLQNGQGGPMDLKRAANYVKPTPNQGFGEA